MTKKIGIITILKVNNYGAELQAYALQRCLNSLGYDAEVIDYLFYKHPDHVRESISRPFYPYPLKNKILEFGLSVRDRLTRLFASPSQKRRQKNFDDFHIANTRLSHTFHSLSELQNGCPEYDVYCVGSDQVWNPRCFTNLAPYLLSFAPDNARKISYASSFGVSSLPSSAEAQYAKFLNRFDAIAVREAAGADIVKKLIGRDAKIVLDPTLLLSPNDWATIEKPVPNLPDRYLLTYELRPQSALANLAQEIARRQGLKIVRLGCRQKFYSDPVVNIADAGPAEFLYLFRNAAFVVTNSFHGTAFSVNFSKPFFSVLERGRNNNSRQLSLLNACGLDSQVYYDGDPFPSSFDVDFSSATQRLASLRNSSIEYLNSAING